MPKRSDSPILVLSQDYELFFEQSGSVEKCLFEPCDALLMTARELGLRITFFVDAGMILCMERHAAHRRSLLKTLDQVKRHVTMIAAAGHEIALHVHPHWEETRWIDDRWRFSDTRYQLRDFSSTDIASILGDYSACLAELSGTRPEAYRAGGFCIEPFHLLKDAFLRAGITIDSSIVPGAYLNDPNKGFDFRAAPDGEWWSFDESPLVPVPDGPFLELPVASFRLPLLYYWQRLAQRLKTRVSVGGSHYGDGRSMSIGRQEIIRRLTGKSRIAELSIDEPKADHLESQSDVGQGRRLWQLMGHPKLVSMRTLGLLKEFVSRLGIEHYETMTSVAALIRSGELSASLSATVKR